MIVIRIWSFDEDDRSDMVYLGGAVVRIGITVGGSYMANQ